MEGVRVSRSGVVCWLGMATKEFVYLFDICSLGPPGFQYGLAEILENPKIMKVVHDCRFVSDALLHQYNIKLLYVFDTQVLILYKQIFIFIVILTFFFTTGRSSMC